MRIHAHIQRAVIDKAEASLGVIQLRRGHAKIEQYTIHSAMQLALRQLIAQLGKTALHNDKAAVFGRQRLPRGNSLRVFVKAQQAALRTQLLQKQATMPAAPEGAIDIAAIAAHSQGLDSFIEQYGDMAKRAGHAHRIRSRRSSGSAPGCLMAARSASARAFQASSFHS